MKKACIKYKRRFFLKNPYIPIICPEDGPVRHGVKEWPVGFVATPVVVEVKQPGLNRHRNCLAGFEAGSGVGVIGVRLGDPSG